MKRTISTIGLLTICAAFLFITSCAKHKILRNIDGKWSINQITYSGGQTGNDSIVSYQNKALVFESCSATENGGANSCMVNLLENDTTYTFTYKVNVENGNKSLSIYAYPNNVPDDKMDLYNNIAKGIVGNYSVLQLDYYHLKLKCDNCLLTQTGRNNYQIRILEAYK